MFCMYLLSLLTLYISCYCNNVRLFSKINKNIVSFCKYFAAISVASSIQVTLHFYFQIFYSTAPNDIVIILTKQKLQNVRLTLILKQTLILTGGQFSGHHKRISNKKHIQRKKSSKYTPVE